MDHVLQGPQNIFPLVPRHIAPQSAVRLNQYTHRRSAPWRALDHIPCYSNRLMGRGDVCNLSHYRLSPVSASPACRPAYSGRFLIVADLLPALHSRQAATRFSISVKPPPERGVMWSTSNTTFCFAPRPQYRHLNPSRSSTANRICPHEIRRVSEICPYCPVRLRLISRRLARQPATLHRVEQYALSAEPLNSAPHQTH